MTVDALLSSLDGVRRAGPDRWLQLHVRDSHWWPPCEPIQPMVQVRIGTAWGGNP